MIVKDDNDVNLDDAFEKILPCKIDRSSEEGSDDVDHEIAEILCEAEPLGHEIKTIDASNVTEVKETNVNSPVIASEIPVINIQASPTVDTAKMTKLVITTTETIEITEVAPESSTEEIAAEIPEVPSELPSTAEEVQKMPASPEASKVLPENPVEPEKLPEEIVNQSQDASSIKPVIEQAKGANGDTKQSTTVDDPIASVDKKLSHEDDKDKPPVPLQTYMWEDLKRAKEQVSDVCSKFLPFVTNTLGIFLGWEGSFQKLFLLSRNFKIAIFGS